MKKLLLIMVLPLALSAMADKPEQDQAFTEGDFKPSWESLSAWECPDWFKDAKFGIWAHWGPQCEPEAGDWYARFMYYPGSGQYNFHKQHYGDPSQFGLKDICNAWKAENWNPKELVNLYKSVGARYFMTLANHHDNFDLWNSPYQEWNSVNIGPKRDLVGEWSEACKEAGIPLGVSVHASHAWTWLEGSQKFDGNLTKEDGYKLNADGSEKWWKGYDPQELYAQNHPHSSGWENSGTIHSQWDWGNGANIPDEAYRKKLMNRTLQLVYDYNPDMIYFDDTALPFWGCDEQWGLDFLSSYYNDSANKHNGKQQVVVTGKQLQPHIKKAMLWDVERGIPDRMQDEYWQTCTCIGDWHYNKDVYDQNRYKSAATVIRMLVDVVSKNGNLLLSIPVKGDGTIDERERAVLDGIKAWMDINNESIYGTRTWKTFGEGPLAEADNPMNAQGFNEGLNYSSADVRFVQKDGTVYATIMGWPETSEYVIKSFGKLADTYSGNVTSVKLLGHGPVEYRQETDGLHVILPGARPNEIAPVLAITVDDATITMAERAEALLEYVAVFLSEIEPSYINSGKYNEQGYNKLVETVEDFRGRCEGADENEFGKIFSELNALYTDFVKSGVNPGVSYKTLTDCQEDLTVEKLVERSGFKRSEGTARFGKPANWTVENYSIPNGGDGVKQGLDRYTGQEALSLGIWNDRDANTEGNLANARIYRKITLPKGVYFFGATYNTTYNISDNAYMFVASEIVPTSAVPDKSIAFQRVNKCAESGTDYYGLQFSLDKEEEIFIGWQADLASGSDTQEFRATKVALLKVAEGGLQDISSILGQMNVLIDNLEQKGIFGTDSGNFTIENFEAIKNYASKAVKESSEVTEDNSLPFYFQLKKDWEDLKALRNPGGSESSDFGADLTAAKLIEASGFATTGTETGTRFARPLNWTVENFSIPNGSSGVKQGIDKYSGENSLSLGVWDDRFMNNDGDVSNARIYRTINLEAGDYFFGAHYNALYQMADAYLFFNNKVIPTADVKNEALAWCDINDARIDDNFHGIYFTVRTPGEYSIGWQANMKAGEGRQEFRADRVLLMKKGSAGIGDTILDEPATLPDLSQPYDLYDLQGMRVTRTVPGAIYILRQGLRSWKIRF